MKDLVEKSLLKLFMPENSREIVGKLIADTIGTFEPADIQTNPVTSQKFPSSMRLRQGEFSFINFRLPFLFSTISFRA
jgi:hypothetical protein